MVSIRDMISGFISMRRPTKNKLSPDQVPLLSSQDRSDSNSPSNQGGVTSDETADALIKRAKMIDALNSMVSISKTYPDQWSNVTRIANKLYEVDAETKTKSSSEVSAPKEISSESVSTKSYSTGNKKHAQKVDESRDKNNSQQRAPS